MKNSLDFIERSESVTLQEGEILISFDVNYLFPSALIPHTLEKSLGIIVEIHLAMPS